MNQLQTSTQLSRGSASSLSLSQSGTELPSPLQSHSVNAEYPVITRQSELHRLRRCLIARVIKPDVAAAPSLNIHERRENTIERRRARAPVPRRPPRTTMHLGFFFFHPVFFILRSPAPRCSVASPSSYFLSFLFLLLPPVDCKPVNLLAACYWKTSDVLFRFGTNNNNNNDSSNDGRNGGGGGRRL